MATTPTKLNEAIILAGGLGTRLRDTVRDLPKCMAPVAGRPFLFYVINYLRTQGITRFVFSLGYKHEVVEAYLAAQFPTLKYKCVVENEPLGTGGAILLACRESTSQQVLIANGDTLFKVDVPALYSFHLSQQARCTLALKPMENFERYGVVELDSDGRVKAFREKQYYTSGLINGGTYILDVASFTSEKWPAKFSFEQNYLEQQTVKLSGLVQNGYFIDIGIPEDYNKAQEELRQPVLDLQKIDKTWTLFLDRDGVINVDKEGSYIFNPDEFIFSPGAPGLFKKLADVFGHILIATNQRGVGRNLMSEEDLAAIHQKMTKAIEAAGGRIDGIYYATSIHNDDELRKPNAGMALKAQNDFPGIDLSRSIMVGNNPSDMLFGRNTGMYTVFIRSTRPDQEMPHPDIDLAFDSLAEFAAAL